MRCLSNFRAIRSFKHLILWLRDYTRFGGNTSYRLVKRGPVLLHSWRTPFGFPKCLVRRTLDKIIVNSKIVNDKTEICNKFNHFFEKIGPKLANQIKSASDKTYDTFLKKRVLLSFAFTLVNENYVLKHLSSLRTKNSAGIDGISVKLLKKLSINKSVNIGN